MGRSSRRAAAAPRRAASAGSQARLELVPWWAWLVLFLAAFSLFPVFESSGYVRIVAFDTVLYMLLALGLNVVVGWGGLLDLGYVAFYGLGAYTYAFLGSHQFGVHLPTIVSVPLVVARRRGGGALARASVAEALRRLPRDRDALLPPALPDAHHERRQRPRSQHHRRAVRDPERRPVQLLRPPAADRARRRLQRRLSVRRPRDLRGRVRRVAVREQLADRSRLAVAA